MRPTRNRVLDRLDHPAWPLIVGVLLALSLPPVGLYPLAWVALVPLFVRWSHERSGWRLFRETYATFLVTAACAGFWVLLHEFASASLVAGAGLFLIPIPFALAFVAAAAVRERFGLVVGLFALGTNLLVVEMLQTHGPLPLPWLLLGHTQADALLFNQTADLGGVGLLSLWTFGVNALLFLTLHTQRTPGPMPGPRALCALLTLATFVAPLAYHDARVQPTAEGTLRIGLVQPAVSAYDWSDLADGYRVDRMADLSERLFASTAASGAPILPAAIGTAARPRREAGGFDLLIWPEGALPLYDDAAMQGRLYERVGRWSAMRGVPLLTGATTFAATAPAPTVVGARGGAQPLYNSALLFVPGQPARQYDKMRMVPLTDQVPLIGQSPLLASLPLPTGSRPAYGEGQRQVLLDVNGVQLGPMIAFESLFGDHARRAAADGADVLVTLSQTGWWGRSPSYEQHFRLSRLRAIETRRAVVFATVNGVSGAIYPDGRIVRAAGWMEERLVGIDVPTGGPMTLYARHGDWVNQAAGMAAFVIGLGWVVAFVRSPRRPRVLRKKR